MKQLKKLPVGKGITPHADKLREQLLKKSRSVDLSASLLMLIAGIALSVISSSSLLANFFSKYQAIVVVPLMIAILVMLYNIATLAKYDLSPKDEYERSQLLQAKTEAFNTLSGLLILIVILHSYVQQVSVIGLVLAALGFARFTEWKKSEL